MIAKCVHPDTFAHILPAKTRLMATMPPPQVYTGENQEYCWEVLMFTLFHPCKENSRGDTETYKKKLKHTVLKHSAEELREVGM